ncbi:MAG: hypothetical protein M1144_05290 [Candidatus Thermoplasmatota archaeon]|jgi:hypothetical protein|nr:hypothetical protein [Candidatus Thermoplasmatota archaeon]
MRDGAFRPVVFNVSSTGQQGGVTAGIVITEGGKYVPPTEALQRKVHDSFMQARSESGQRLGFIVEVEAGSTERHRIAIDLETMVGDSEVLVYPKGNTYIGRFPDYPITVIVHQANVGAIQRFIEELGPYIESQWGILPSTSFPPNLVKFYIGGTPTFGAGGRVRIT